MRRFQALLIAAGLAAASANAAAGPSGFNHPADPTTVFEKLEWSMARGRLGVLVIGLTPELRTHFGAPTDRGVLVARVEPRSPAAAAGIATGDVLVDVAGKPVDDAGDVTAALADAGTSKPVSIKLVRDKKPVTVQASVAARESSGPQWLRELMSRFTKREPAANN
jgi:S1-C subfamily serine protease